MTARPRPDRTAARVAEPAPLEPVRAREPFERFYEREFRSVVGLAYALSGSRSASEDLAQEAFISAHRNWDRIGAYDKPEAWVRRVTANLAVSRFRRRVAEAKALARAAGMRKEHVLLPELDADAERFWGAVRRLPRRQAQAVALHYLEDRSVADVADILGCAPNTVKVHLHKARAKLAEDLADLAAPDGAADLPMPRPLRPRRDDLDRGGEGR